MNFKLDELFYRWRLVKEIIVLILWSMSSMYVMRLIMIEPTHIDCKINLGKTFRCFRFRCFFLVKCSKCEHYLKVFLRIIRCNYSNISKLSFATLVYYLGQQWMDNFLYYIYSFEQHKFGLTLKKKKTYVPYV